MKLEKYFQKIKENSKGKFLIGVTGQVGTGKSTILAFFKERGAFTISADEITDKVLTKRQCYSKILLEFGKEVGENGTINKKKLAEIVFNSDTERKRLEKLLHPLILKEIVRLVKQSIKEIIVIEVPLLFESGFDKYMDLSICSYLDRREQLKRLKKRGWTKENALSRINSQLPMSKKAEMSDIVIDNTQNLNFLKEQVFVLYDSLRLVVSTLNKGR